MAWGQLGGEPRSCPQSCPRLSKEPGARQRTSGNKKPRVSAGLVDCYGCCRTGVWWRRGELNPRPPMLRLRFYMLSLVFGFHPQLPNRHGSLEPIPLGFSSIGEGRASALFGKSRRLIPEYRHCRVKRSPEFRRRGRSWSRSQLAFLQTV